MKEDNLQVSVAFKVKCFAVQFHVHSRGAPWPWESSNAIQLSKHRGSERAIEYVRC